MKKWFQKQLGRQLSEPQGFCGLIVAKLMNIGNKLMYTYAYESAAFKTNDSVLEIGFGNGAFIKDIAQKITPGAYTGVDISDTMLKEAQRRNSSLINLGKVDLKKANAEQLPFPKNSFNKVFTVNTIYFWENPSQVMEEVKRVLLPGGSLVVALATKEVMQGSEHVKERFKLYELQDVEHLFKAAGFTAISSTYRKLKVEDALCVKGHI